jgi:dipeptide/tripeptide permease
VSATGLEFAYSQAPPSFKGSILALYYVAIACGNLLGAVLSSTLASALSSFQLLVLFAGLMCGAGLLFIVAACLYVPLEHNDTGNRGGSGASPEAPPPDHDPGSIKATV